MSTRFSTGLINQQAGLRRELVTNGNFATDAASWTAATATLTWTSGAIDGRTNTLKVSGSAGYGHQALTAALATKVGHVYKLTYMYDNTAGNGYVKVGSAAGGSQDYASGNLSTTGAWTTVTVYFVASSATTFISLGTDGTGDHYYDAISLVDLAASFQQVFHLGNVKIYSGTQPASADTAPTGTLLCTINNGGTGITFADAGTGATSPGDTAGYLSKTVGETWSGVCSASGTAGWFRLCAPGDLGTTNTTDCRIDGTVATSGGEITLTSTAFTVGATQTLSDLNPYVPAA